MKLWLKLTLSFLLIAAIGVAIVGYLANQATTTGFNRYLSQDGQTQLEDAQRTLTSYYAQQGSWEGVESLLSAMFAGRGQGGQGGGAWVLLDAAGSTIAQSGAGRGRGQELLAATEGTPLTVNGRLIGTLYLGNAGMGQGNGLAENQFINEVNRALVIAALIAVILALLLAILLAQGLTRPLRQLTQATHALANGDLSQQVPVRSSDELGDLSHSFNQMADTLRHAEKQRQQLLADVAHELRTPLAVMQGNIEAMLDGVFELSPENLTTVHEEAVLLRRLVDELRTLSLAEAGQLHLNREPLNLADVARQAAAAFEPLADAEGVKLVTTLADDLPTIHADRARLQQVLGNLLGNALRHAPQGSQTPPTIRVMVQSANDGIRFAVADNGPGMTAAAAAHVFDRFWRADAARSRDQGGSGLGLAICQGIVQAHNGRIWVETSPGNGAAFWVELPTPPNTPNI